MKSLKVASIKVPQISLPSPKGPNDPLDPMAALRKFMTPQQSGAIGALKQGKRVGVSKFTSK